MKHELEQTIADVCKKLFGTDTKVILTRPDPQFGDYATNIALQLAKQLGKNPREVAGSIVKELSHPTIKGEPTIAGPGFINLSLTDEALWKLAHTDPVQSLANKTVVAEYSDPNPFKVLHAGHLYTSIVGDSISRLLELAGADVKRINFGGDVGLHVGKTMWAIIKELGGENYEKLSGAVFLGSSESDKIEKRASWLSKRYVEGNSAYEENPEAKAEIVTLNKRVYSVHSDNDHTSEFAKIYWECRQWSYDFFDFFYEQIGIKKFDAYYPESQTAPLGLDIIKKNIGSVYEESEGAIVFNGEKHGLHTRVFINSEGLPTYEAKDVGLIFKKWDAFKFDQSIIITGSEIIEYMKVVLKSIEQIEPELAKRTKHITHGHIKLAGGVKMSSRKGNTLKALDIIAETGVAVSKSHESVDPDRKKQIVYGAIKHSFLKQRIGGDIIYDPQESVSIAGNSGPYMQYAYVRARSILNKSSVTDDSTSDFDDGERLLLKKLSQYPEVLEQAIQELLPSHICTYLYELAQVFNRFYETNKVIGHEREAHRRALLERYVSTLNAGLGLLGISAPEKM